MPDRPLPPLHALSPTTRFTDRAGDYARSRPSYPPEAIDAILSGLGDPARLSGADVGAGTGISARLLADRGVAVTAVEPNAAMRDAASPHPRITWLSAAAESTGLPAHAFDLVLCAQSFHWFRADEALAEFARLLRPAGRLALMWNIRDDADEFTRLYGEVINSVSTINWGRSWKHDVPPLRESPHFKDVRALRFPYRQRHTEEDLLRRAMSASYVPKDGPDADRLLAGLRTLHARHADPAGAVTLVYATELYLADPAT